MASTIPGKSILIVDDSPLIRERLLIMLKSVDGIGRVHSAGDFSSAMRLLTDPLPEIVLLDINLPGGSGIDLLRHIKARYPWIRVVMVTNQAGDYYQIVCKNLGADYFIDKSKDFDRVPVLISSLR